MHTPLDIDEVTGPAFVSTGHLPPAERVDTLLAEAYKRCKSVDEGKVADYIPALARTPRDLFGLCVVETNGAVHAAGDTEYEFSIQSVSKPFVFALVCQAIGQQEARKKLGVNATGLPFPAGRLPGYKPGEIPEPDEIPVAAERQQA
jgi:glutaminase